MNRDEALGRRLKKARLKLGFSLDQIYKSIKVHPQILESLEDDKIDPKLGEIYIKAFLKKYSNFLGFKTDDILSEFIAKRPLPKKIQTESLITIGDEKRRRSVIIKDKFKKSVLPVAILSALLLTVFIIGYAGFRLVRGFSKFQTTPSETVTDQTSAAMVEPSSLIPADQPLVLKVETSDAVWLRVKSDGKVVFEHTLPKGSVESWRAEDELELWAGRAEALDLTLNDSPLGSPGSGLIKKITISREGLQIEKR